MSKDLKVNKMRCTDQGTRKALSAINGTPKDVFEREARIFKVPRHTMQSGTSYTHQWKIEFEKAPRWSAGVMGWTGSADPVQAFALKFDSLEEAVSHAKNNGYKFTVDEESGVPRKLEPKSYADNFKYIPPSKPIDL
jgi:hypothetical protein